MYKRNTWNRVAPVLMLALILLTTGAAMLGAQEGPPPPPEGLTFSGSVITGLRYRSIVDVTDYATAGTPPTVVYGYNVFDVDAGDDYLVEGDTASLRGELNKGAWGAAFGLSLNANKSYGGFWTPRELYVSEASLWGKILDNKLQVKAGYFGDMDYFSPIMAWSLAGGPASNALQLTVYPTTGLQIDVRTKNLPNTGKDGLNTNLYTGEQFGRNIDAGVRYVNPSFTAWLAFDDDWTAYDSTDPFSRANESQTDVFGYFAFTGVPKLSVGVETKFLDLTSERKDGSGEEVGITNVTALNASYQFTDAFSARIWLLAGSSVAGLAMVGKELLGDDGFTFAVDLEGTYKLTDTLAFSFRPIFHVFDSEHMDAYDIYVKPKLAWTLAPFPYAATINFWYMLKVFSGDEKNGNYTANNNEALNHTVACTFGWTF